MPWQFRLATREISRRARRVPPRRAGRRGIARSRAASHNRSFDAAPHPLAATMQIEPRWIVSTSASSLHAAAALLAGQQVVSSTIPPAVAAEVEELGADLAALGLAPASFFDHAIPLAVRFD